MRLNEMTFSAAHPIDGYGPGFFRVAGRVFKGSALVLPTGVVGWAGYGDFQSLFELGDDLDVVLIGTGTEMTAIPSAFRAALEAVGLGAEPMATPQACRTYNVLLGEGRRVAAALLPV